MPLVEESSFKTLAKALEPLELAGQLRYLPAFECCGSCAGARLNGFTVGETQIHADDWGDYELYVTFGEQAVEEYITTQIWLTAWAFGLPFSKEDEDRINRIVADELIAGGFREIPAPAEEHLSANFDPNYEFNTFFIYRGSIVVRGYFTGKPKPTKAVRKLGLHY